MIRHGRTVAVLAGVAFVAFVALTVTPSQARSDLPSKPTTGVTRPRPWWEPTTTAGTVAPTTEAPTTTLPPCPSGACMPMGDATVDGHLWRQIVAEDFTKPAASGSWGNTTCTDRVVYTGASGTPWMAYPSCFLDTYQHRPYRSDAVLSVHDGTLDFWLHTVDGNPAGANPSPVLPGGSKYQTYGRYSFRARQTVEPLGDFYQAFLLWPQDNNYQCAETDFPEAGLGSVNVWAFNHQCATTPPGVSQFGETIDKTAWHTYTMKWEPGQISYSIDGVWLGTATVGVTALARRWQLQIETNTTAPQGQSGHYLVDWAVVYSY